MYKGNNIFIVNIYLMYQVCGKLPLLRKSDLFTLVLTKELKRFHSQASLSGKPYIKHA